MRVGEREVKRDAGNGITQLEDSRCRVNANETRDEDGDRVRERGRSEG